MLFTFYRMVDDSTASLAVERNGRSVSSNGTSPSKSPLKEKGKQNKIAVSGRLTETEKMERGSIPWSTYHLYIKSAGGYIVAFFVLLTFILNVFSTCKFNTLFQIAHRLNTVTQCDRILVLDDGKVIRYVVPIFLTSANFF